MSNNSKKQENDAFSFDTDVIMSAFSNFAPFLLLVSAVGSFVIVGIFTADYYNTMFWARFQGFAFSMACGVVVLEELTRFSFLVSSVKDFKDKKKAEGFFGLLISLMLVAHDITIATKVGQLWGLGELPLIFAIVIGFAIEIRMVMTMGKKQSIEPTKEEPVTPTLPVSKKFEPIEWNTKPINGKSVLDNTTVFHPIGFNVPTKDLAGLGTPKYAATSEEDDSDTGMTEKERLKNPKLPVVEHILTHGKFAGEARHYRKHEVLNYIKKYSIAKNLKQVEYWEEKLKEFDQLAV